MKKTFREWLIVCNGIGPIRGTNSRTRTGALLMKRQQWPDNDQYQVTRVKITLDPEKRSPRR